MRTLVISDLHLGSRVGRDILRLDVVLERLCEALPAVDRLVLLGDTVELLEGRPVAAMREAEPVLRAIGQALGPGKQVVLLPGNHDGALVRPWLAELRAAGKPLGVSARVPLRSSPLLQQLSRWLKPARLQVRYPGADLGDGIWAHHGHYVDRHLVRGPKPGGDATPSDYERNRSAVRSDDTAEPTGLGRRLDDLASMIRVAGIRSRPLVASLPGAGVIAPLTASALGYQFRKAGLPAMTAVGDRLGVRSSDIVFGHLHRAGPLETDDATEWATGDRRLWNSGSWVYEPLLLTGAGPENPYWPGGALQIDDGEITVVNLLEGLGHEDLVPPRADPEPAPGDDEA